MITKSVYPSDDDIDVDLVFKQKNDSNSSLAIQFTKQDDFGIIFKLVIYFYLF